MSLDFLPILLLLTVVVVMAVVRLMRRRATPHAAHDLPVCGKCGYAVRGISTFNCPECGADLREVGIVTPGAPRGAGRLGWATFWTIALVILAGLLTPVITNALGGLRRSTVSQFTLVPRGGHYRGLDLVVEDQHVPTASTVMGSSASMSSGTGPHHLQSTPLGALHRAQLILRLNAVAPPTELALTPAGGSYTSAPSSAPVAVSWPPTGTQLERWMTDAGVTPAPGEAAEVAQALNDLAHGAGTLRFNTFVSVQRYTYNHTTRSPWPTLAVLGFWLVLWLAGLRYLTRAKRPTTAAPPHAEG